MLPKRWLGVCCLSSGLALAGSLLCVSPARAQGGVIDLDEEDEQVDEKAPAPGPSVTAGHEVAVPFPRISYDDAMLQ